ncbi:hypothetical protein [Vibrio marisflavi]|uniref:Defence against restriction A N-terminal domain-containing protein n=1 Tax=Vibrio marisflavi CECT 7928 TaxID=634439 RepID=A0ABM9AA51_9VIBR|nr:hypothetical protein [Vibrio marisflavi]CAH0543096.1 hypothetical protein VMF7928_04398 [Vibrio marisflavi CECT 7928]
MSNFAKKNNHDIVVVDFDNVTEKGLKKLISALKSAGAPVTDVEASNKKVRKDSLFVKKAKLHFENGQAMTLFIGDQGDIYQMTLNSTKQPIPSVKNERQLAKEMAKLLDRNQAKFDKAQARKAKKAIAKDTSDNKPASRSVAKRLEEAKTTLKDVQADHTDTQSTLTKTKKQLTDSQARISELQAELATETAETKELEKQLEELQ